MCLSPDPPEIPVDFCISYSLQIFFACLFCFYMTTVKSSVVVIDWHQPCQVPTQLQLSTTDRKEKKKNKKKAYSEDLCCVAQLWDSHGKPSHAISQSGKRIFLSSFLSFFLPFCLSFYLSFFPPSLPSFFFSLLLSWHQNFFIAPLIQRASLSSHCHPLSTFTPTCKLYWERGGRGRGIGRENTNVFNIVGWNVSSHPPPLEAVLQIWRWWNI